MDDMTPPVYCPNCKKEVPPDADYCPRCGAPASISARVSEDRQVSGGDSPTPTQSNLVECIHCGEMISKDAQECPHCGAKLVMFTSENFPGGCGCGCLALILAAIADQALPGAGVVLLVLILIGMVTALADVVVKSITGRSITERIHLSGRARQ